MKNLTFNTGKLFLTVLFCWISLNSSSQNVKLSKEEQKEARKAELYANYQALDSVLSSKRFVLQAEFLKNQYGDRINVTSILNFIKVDSTKGVLQTGFNNANPGFNGVGGVTAVGTINNWRLDKNPKKLTYFLRFGMVTNIGVFDISMYISADNYSQATLTGLTPGKLIFEGQLVIPSNAGIFKGTDSF
jgi:hypothetical protein